MGTVFAGEIVKIAKNARAVLYRTKQLHVSDGLVCF